jgi:hypothetical protein
MEAPSIEQNQPSEPARKSDYEEMMGIERQNKKEEKVA